MPKESLSFFEEKRDIVKAKTEWGFWWQTVQEIHIEVQLNEKISAREVFVKIEPKRVKCVVKNNIVFEGDLHRTVYADESVWTIEDGNLYIVLAKSDFSVKDEIWESLLTDGKYQPDAWTLHEMRKNFDLERFQIENPGMDFSRAKLSKHYDKLPGWSNDRLAELKAESEDKTSEKQS